MVDQQVAPVFNANRKTTHTGAIEATGASSLTVLGKCSGADLGSLVPIKERAAARARVRVIGPAYKRRMLCTRREVTTPSSHSARPSRND